MTEIELSNPVHRLTQPWVLVLNPAEAGTYKPQDFPPLLEMLQGMVTPNSGKTRGGANDPAARSVIDVKALDLLTAIEDTTRAWLHEWRQPVTRTITTDVQTFYRHLETLWRTAGISESEYVGLSESPERWARAIWDLIEPPLQVPLRATSCPRCGRSKWVNEHGEWVDNLLVSYRAGDEVVALCRWRSCGASWTGPRELRELGFSLGVQADEATLTEMGV